MFKVVQNQYDMKSRSRNLIETFYKVACLQDALESLSEKLSASQQTETTLGKFDTSQQFVTTDAGGAESPSAFCKSF